MQHIKILSLNNIIVLKTGGFHYRITFYLYVFHSHLGFQMKITSTRPVQTMGHCNECACFKTFFYFPQSTGSVLPNQTYQHFCDVQLTKHTLKSAWCKCPSPQINLFLLISTVYKDQSLLKTPQNGLVPTYDIKVICWFDKTGSRLCHRRRKVQH